MRTSCLISQHYEWYLSFIPNVGETASWYIQLTQFTLGANQKACKFFEFTGRLNSDFSIITKAAWDACYSMEWSRDAMK